jgi:adenine-specific DNA-methyltransferase
MMIQRYLGNKSAIADDIVAIVQGVAAPGDLVFDAFSGSLAVSRALKGAGFRVACNDINHFSWLNAQAYLACGSLPWPVGPLSRLRTKDQSWSALMAELTKPYGDDIPKKYRRADVFDHYTEAGRFSSFVSSRGSVGNRRFFSSENGRLIDRALSRIRYWYRAEIIDEQTRCLLGSALLAAVEKVSNTQGTYHDFPRDFYDPRALKTINIVPPSKYIFAGPPSEYVGKAQDSLEYAKSVPYHKVLYLDPPYNFRQYTSYYFLLNAFSMHPEIDDLDAFFANIEFVRGQNMSTDFKSSFCSKAQFIPSIKRLVDTSKAEYVILSYFDGRNHWGEFKSDNDVIGKPLIEGLFNSDLFEKGSLQCFPIDRMNYQSYGGYKSKSVQEFLFVAKKRSLVTKSIRGEDTPWIGQAAV